MKRKLLLVNPRNQQYGGQVNREINQMMPLALGIVAALTPDDWLIEFIDENFETFSLKEADIVAFTAFTANAPRVYEIAAVCRDAGIHTVMGGVHASMYSEEALHYVDTVVSGEAESSWPSFIRDFLEGKPLKYYQGELVDINTVPFVKRDIFDKYPYKYDLVQTSRGCPMGCDFCSVTQFCGKSYRERAIEDVIEELKQTKRGLIFFVDDNLVNNNKGAQERAITLFRKMIEHKVAKPWFSQAALNFADNEQVLYWARKSGCMMILLGVEAESREALKEMKKNLNLKKGVDAYEPIFKKIHKYGIGVLATMIFAMESDSVEDLYARRDFIKKSSFDSYQTSILTPFPGTRLFERVNTQGKIEACNYPHDWRHYIGTVPVLKHDKMTTDQIRLVMKEIWLTLYTKEAVRRQLFKTLRQTRSFKTAYWSYGINHTYSRWCLEGVYDIDARSDKDKNGKRPLYLRVTDKVLWLMYQLAWRDITRRFEVKGK